MEQNLVLGVDPGYTRTAFAVLGEKGPEYLRDFSLDISRKNESEQMQARMVALFKELDAVLLRYPTIEHVGVEKIDWHQSARSATFNYQRERNTQASMAQFKTMFSTYAMMAEQRIARKIETHFIGANDWKLQYGASSKLGVMEQCHIRYQDRILWNREKQVFYFANDGHVLKDHETDAIAIATVLRDRLLNPELAQVYVPNRPARTWRGRGKR